MCAGGQIRHHSSASIQPLKIFQIRSLCNTTAQMIAGYLLRRDKLPKGGKSPRHTLGMQRPQPRKIEEVLSHNDVASSYVRQRTFCLTSSTNLVICAHHERCHAHLQEDYMDPRPVLVPPHRPKPGSQPCKYYARGNCARGNKCWFSHGSQVGRLNIH